MGFHEEDERFLILVKKQLNGEELNKEESDEFDNIWWGLDRINIREFKFKEYSEQIPSILQLLARIGQAPHHSLEYGNIDTQDLFFSAQNLGLLDLYSFLYEYYKLLPPYVKHGVKIPPKVKELFWESRICFIADLYNSSVAISRAIVERTIKHLLGTEISEKYLKNLIWEAYKTSGINLKAREIALNINAKANDILHGEKLASKNEAEKIIDDTKNFIQEVY